MEPMRERRVAALGAEPTLREWIDCLVGPITEHFDALGAPSWFARFSAQIQSDPHCGDRAAEARSADTIDLTIAGIRARLPELPEAVVEQRFRMMQMLLVLSPASVRRRWPRATPCTGRLG